VNAAIDFRYSASSGAARLMRYESWAVAYFSLALRTALRNAVQSSSVSGLAAHWFAFLVKDCSDRKAVFAPGSCGLTCQEFGFAVNSWTVSMPRAAADSAAL
jgi:hypothetical protein